MQYGELLVNEFAPELWDFTQANVPELSAPIPELHVAMWNIAAGQVFQNMWTPLGERVVRHYLRRIISAANSYEDARRNLADFFEGHRRDVPKLRAYFAALDLHETCLVSSQIAVNSLSTALPSKEADELTEKYKNIDLLSNNVKHFAGQSKSSAGSHNKTFPIFYRNDGITNGRQFLSFVELSEFLEFGLRTANGIISRN